ncbi:hypothetical protein RugamoR57_36480 [Duganella caerulea]|uniref:hypothetical protein n=1 Tax=Duganella caerulea TaxID=2885762 RepID=UPI0030E886A7
MRTSFLSLLLACAAAAHAGDLPEPTDGWTAVDDARLDQARGGYELGGGLVVSLGVERLVSINGSVVANSRFAIADVTKLSAAEAQMAGDALAAVVVRNGAGNAVDALPAAPGLGALLIQNSVSDQAIRSQTTISTSVSNLALLKAANFETLLRDALSGAVGPK